MCCSNLTLSEAAHKIVQFTNGVYIEYAVASPDLWNRRQDSGKSGFEIMQAIRGMPPMRPADDRRIAGWRVLREYLASKGERPFIRISNRCTNLISSLPALLCDARRTEDASSTPHKITHSPEALRYAVMSRAFLSCENDSSELMLAKDFRIARRSSIFD